MNEFDDRELRDALRRRAGMPTDGFGLEAARSAVVARAVRVRRRRAAVAGGAAMAGLVAAAVFVIGPGTDSVVTTPADGTDPSTPASVDTSVDATAAVPTVPDQTDRDQTRDTATPADTSPAPTITVAATGPPNGAAPSTTSPPAPGTTVSAPTTSSTPPPSTSPTVPDNTTVPPPATSTETYSSLGGSITVRWDGAALALQSVSPAVGFDAEVEDERPDRIRVRFRGDGGDSRIEIRVENGQIVRVE